MSDSDELNEEADQILKEWEEKYDLPASHCEYYRADLIEILESRGAIRERQLKEIEHEIKSSEYILVHKVGAGGFGSVYQGKSKKDASIVAIKIIDLESCTDEIKDINQEIMALANGKACDKLTRYFSSHAIGSKLWIVMEYVDGGSVRDRIKIKTLSEPQIAVIVSEVLKGLEYLALDSKFHRDIKAANILVSKKGQIKLADFGATRQLSDTMAKASTWIGSPYWMAPEVIMTQSYDYKADIWSLGITCLEMATGNPPHYNLPTMQIPNLIAKYASQTNIDPAKDPYRLDNSDNKFSQDFCNFVRSCLQRNPNDRPSIKALQQTNFVLSAENVDIQKTFELSEPD